MPVRLLILRLGMGGYMLTHGWGKLQMALAGDFDKFGDPIGLGSGPSLVLMVAAAPIVFGMAVATFVAHGGDPWTVGQGAVLFLTGESQSWASKEPALPFLIPFLALIFTGTGRLSIDGPVWPRWRERRARRKAAGLGKSVFAIARRHRRSAAPGDFP